MKKITLFLFGFLLFTCLTHTVKADFSKKIEIDEVINRRNIVITHPQTDEQYLLYLKSGCDNMETGQTVTLVVRGMINSSNDYIKLDSLHRCAIGQADQISKKLYVHYLYHRNTRARVENEEGAQSIVSFGRACSALTGYRNQYIYSLQGDDNLSVGDRIIMPNKSPQCSISYVRTIETSRPKVEKNIDKSPTMATNVKAFPRNGAVFLSWRKSRDDKGVSHYIVGYNTGRINTKEVTPDDMSYTAQTKTNQIVIDSLENDQSYYFYVIAVDSAGQTSSDWSSGASATPKASILKSPTRSSGGLSLDLKITKESSRSFLIKWKKPKGATRQTIIFEIDGEREFVRLEYPRSYIRILKRSHREGQPLTLKVREYGLRSLLIEETLNFEY